MRGGDFFMCAGKSVGLLVAAVAAFFGLMFTMTGGAADVGFGLFLVLLDGLVVWWMFKGKSKVAKLVAAVVLVLLALVVLAAILPSMA